MTPDAQQQRQFMENYYGFLVGATVAKVAFREDEFDGEAWPVLTCTKPVDEPMTIDDRSYAKGETFEFEVEVSRDEEGNGPGFLFGLPGPTS